MNLSWNEFCDKVYGCFMGKCIAGTIGAPYEGYKGIMDVEYTPELFGQAQAQSETIPNDDLDLQVLWLDVIEKVGANFTSDDLAKAFYEKCPYAPGEYATFKRNYELGLKPPLTGSFNNNYYIEGMGAPIRAEIWACMAPGEPKLAAELAAKDACLDHQGESVIAEQYIAALEALAFTTKSDIRILIVKALDYIDEKSKFYAMASKVIDLCSHSKDWKQILTLILRDYGHPDCTNMFQNMGIILMALLLGAGNFITTVMLALNCGFDTDCTCATVGSIIGICEGAKNLNRKYKFGDQKFALGVNTKRRSDRVLDLAMDVAKAALLFADRNKKTLITGAPAGKMPTIESKSSFPIRLRIEYENNDPSIAPGESKQILIRLEPTMRIKVSGTVKFTAPSGFSVKPEEKKFKIGMFNPDFTVNISAAKDIPVLMEKNIIECTVTLENGDIYRQSFGIVGSQIWKIYGPFWENTSYAPPPKAMESYYNSLPAGSSESESLTILRQFHLNMKADWKKEYLEEQLLGNAVLPQELLEDPTYSGFVVYIRKDKFSFSDFMSNTMPCVVYMVRDVYAESDMTLNLQVGHCDVFRIWHDGNLMAYSDCVEHWTPENIHIKNVILHRGCNRFVVKAARSASSSDFSMMFTKGGPCTDIITALGSGRL